MIEDAVIIATLLVVEMSRKTGAKRLPRRTEPLHHTRGGKYLDSTSAIRCELLNLSAQLLASAQAAQRREEGRTNRL